jgi:hypothetical protein
MKILRNLLVVAGCLLLLSSSVWPQQSQAPSIRELQQQVEKLTEIDVNPGTAREVKEINRQFLNQRRIQLRSLLGKELEALRNYSLSVASSLTAQEMQLVKSQIATLEKDLQNLEKSLGENSASAFTAGDASTPNASPVAPSSANDGDNAAVSLVSSSSMPTSVSLIPATPQTPQPIGSTSLNFALNAAIRSKARVAQTDNTKQTETPSMSENSTSLVDQSSASDLIGVATNLAGLSATSNKNQPDTSSVAVTTSAYALLAGFNHIDPLNPVFYNQHRGWRNFSITLGYDDEDQKDGTKQRSKLFGAKYLFINKRDPNLARNKVYIDRVTNSLATAAARFGDLSIRVRGFAFNLPDVRKNIILPGFTKFLEQRKPVVELALERARNSLATAPADQRPVVETRIKTSEETLDRINNLLLLAKNGDPGLLVLGTNSLPTPSWTREEKEYQIEFLNEYLGPNFRDKLGKDAADAIDVFIDQQLNDAELIAFRNLDDEARAAVEHIRRAPQLSLAFLTRQRKIGNNEYSGEAIFDYGIQNRVNLTLNGAYRYKDSKIIGGDTRGFMFSGQLQFQLNRENLLGKKPFYLDVSTQGNWMTGTKATYKAQGKITIPIADGIDFPISVTYANRTELIKENTVKGQFGFTVDTARLIRALTFR